LHTILASLRSHALLAAVSFMCFLLLNSTAATAASLLPAFVLHFNHFITPLLADLTTPFSYLV
jgi:hypothetical protein